jgi:hypothetical protein
MVDRTKKYSEDEAPKWSYWEQFKKVTLEEAILLSLGINPDLVPHKLESLQSFWNADIAERTEIAYSWASGASWAPFAVDRVPSIDMVNLRKFIIWCHVERKWHALPTEFLAIGEIGGEEDKERVVEVIPTPKPKNAREEANDLRLIGALLAIIKNDEVYKTEAELIDDLMSWYDFSPFAQRTLQDRFSKAKKALEEAK